MATGLAIYTTLAFGFSDIGGGEMVVMGLLALLLFGKNLPKQARNLGRAITEFKRTLNQATEEIQREIRAAADTTEEAVKETAHEIAKDNPFPAVQQEVKNSFNEISPAPAPAPPASDTAPSPGPVTSPYNTGTASTEAPRPAALTVSAAAALDELARNLPPPSKIPPPVF